MARPRSSGLVRGIYRWDLVALSINGTIGAGIFGLPSKVYGLVGSYSLLSFLVAAIAAGAIALCFAEVSSRFSENGGPYLYAREAFGPVIGFEIGWLAWLQGVTAFATVCNLLVGYLGYFWPAATAGGWRAAVITGIVLLYLIVNLVGVREAAIVSDVFTIGKLLPILLFVGVGLFFLQPGHFSATAHPGLREFSTSAMLAFYAFTGFESVGITAGETRDARQNLTFAMLLGLAVVTMLYLLIQTVCIGTFLELAASERPLADASRRFLGSAGVSIVVVGALISAAGAMGVSFLMAPRLLFAMAERNQLPRVLAATHPRFHTPHFAILVSAVLMLVLTLSGTFIYLVTVSVLIRLLTYVATCGSLPTLRREEQRFPAIIQVRGGVPLSVAALGVCAWLIASTGQSQARDVAIAASVGLLIYFAHRK